MQITAADLDRLNPPKEAEELINLASQGDYRLQGGWDTSRNNRSVFSLRISGAGSEVIVSWARTEDGETPLSHVLSWQPDTKKWVPTSLEQVLSRLVK